MTRRLIVGTALLVGVAVALVLSAGCGRADRAAANAQPQASTATTAGPAGSTELPRGAEPVELDPGDFVAQIDNPYMPLTPGGTWTYVEETPDAGPQRVEVTVTDGTQTILGIDAVVVHDVVTRNGALVEDTYDWYAQDRSGNVWYLGEDTKEYENGEVVSTKGSWEAGVDGAQAGIIMPADPEAGMVYRQEHYAGEAEDQGEIVSLGERAQVPYGAFDQVVMTRDTTPLDPDLVEHKFYAPGVGLVLAIAVSSGGDREELVSFVSAP